MLEKLAPALLAGVPAIVKPATATCYLTELVVRRIVEIGSAAEGCAAAGLRRSSATCSTTSVARTSCPFTGSAATAARLRTHPRSIRQSVRFIAETDSLNSSILGPDAAPGTPEFDLFVKEVAREMTVKAGQKCTAIRKALVPRALDRVRSSTALQALLAKTVRRRPARAKACAWGRWRAWRSATRCVDASAELAPRGGTRGGRSRAFEVSGRGPRAWRIPAAIAAAVPRCRCGTRRPPRRGLRSGSPTIIGYQDVADAIALARRGEGSLAGSVFTADDRVARELVLGLAPYHGRVLVVNRDCAKESTGHGSPLAPSGARRPGPRRRRRGNGRHPRRPALHAAHGRAGLAAIH